MKYLIKTSFAIVILAFFSLSSNLSAMENRIQTISDTPTTTTSTQAPIATVRVTPPVVTIPPIIQLTFSTTERQAIIQDIKNIIHPTKKSSRWSKAAIIGRILILSPLLHSVTNLATFFMQPRFGYLRHAGYGLAATCALDGSISLICKIKDYIKDGKGSIAGPVIRNCPKLLIAAVLFKILGW